MTGTVQFVATYAPWLAWLVVMLLAGWRFPAWIQPTDNPLKDAGRRIALGAVSLTVLSLPIIYLIASFQASVFGEDGMRWAAPSVLLATIVIIAPSVYIPLLLVRCGHLYLSERGRST